ncbi:MAG: hypothetical protein IJ760_02990 [Bacteroidales bacterium]|nr:hypothetical protein [Bacteroidales bacterium]
MNRVETVSPASGIAVVGVGGCGLTVLRSLCDEGMQGVACIACDDDEAALSAFSAGARVLLHAKGNRRGVDLCRNAALASAEDVKSAIPAGTRLVVVVGGLGGCVGAGAMPVVSRLAKSVSDDCVVLVVAALPLSIEGMERVSRAAGVVDDLLLSADGVMTVGGGDVGQDAHLTLNDAMSSQVNKLCSAVRVLSVYCLASPDDAFHSLQLMFASGGRALFVVGEGDGENRVRDAIDDALHTFRDASLGASAILLRLCCSERHELTLDEFYIVSEHVKKRFGEEVVIQWTVDNDNSLGGKVRVALVASRVKGLG